MATTAATKLNLKPLADRVVVRKLEAEEKIPSLLKSYLKAGAKVGSYPAYDEEFQCIDFVTLIDRNEMDEKLVKKFKT